MSNLLGSSGGIAASPQLQKLQQQMIFQQLMNGFGGNPGALGAQGSAPPPTPPPPPVNGAMQPSGTGIPNNIKGKPIFQHGDFPPANYNPQFFNPNSLQAYQAMGTGQPGFPSPFAGMGLLNPMTGGTLDQPWLGPGAGQQLPPSPTFAQAYGTGQVQNPPLPPPLAAPTPGGGTIAPWMKGSLFAPGSPLGNLAAMYGGGQA